MVKFWLVVFTASYFSALGPYDTPAECETAMKPIAEANDWSVAIACTTTPKVPLKMPPMNQSQAPEKPPESKK